MSFISVCGKEGALGWGGGVQGGTWSAPNVTGPQWISGKYSSKQTNVPNIESVNMKSSRQVEETNTQTKDLKMKDPSDPS